MAFLLPYIEQDPLFKQLQFSGNSGWGNTSNDGKINGAKIPVYRCPSSPLPEYAWKNCWRSPTWR